MSDESTSTPYDTLPYPLYTYPATHIGKIGAVGRIFGLNAIDPARARVLELGCGTGVNLLAMAQIFPDGEFVGIDASKRQIDDGREILAATGVKNLRLMNADLFQMNEDLGKFDYIITHGIFSWVPQEVRDSILRISSENLAANGIAYVSYNCLPGWHMRSGLRDMMLMHTSGFSNITDKVAQARALVKFLAESCAEETPHGRYLRKELEMISKADDGYIAHDFLEPDNAPYYFNDFLKAAAKFGLGYLGDTDPSTMIIENLPKSAAQTLKSLKLSLVATEQYMDYVRNRTFRRTLLCHANTPLTRKVDTVQLTGLHVSSQMTLKHEASEGKPAVFTSVSGAELSTNEPAAVEMFRHLSQLGKSSRPIDELIDGVVASMADRVKHLDPAVVKSNLSRFLLQTYFRRMVDLTIGAPGRRTTMSSNPEALPLARQQAARGLKITTQRLEMSASDPFVSKLITLCDGSRDRHAIIADIVAAIENKELLLAENNQAITDPSHAKFLVERLYDSSIQNLTKNGILLTTA
jgi:methyltransferase-like protein/2-polyprenyl-3-methyl-5-hydroxy-6-metoxy-1,4-benzoquinol methylase